MLLMQRFRGLSEAFFCVQLVAEGSLSNRRAFGVAMAKVRHNNAERSAFQLNQRNDLVLSNENASIFEAFHVIILKCDAFGEADKNNNLCSFVSSVVVNNN